MKFWIAAKKLNEKKSKIIKAIINHKGAQMLKNNLYLLCLLLFLLQEILVSTENPSNKSIIALKSEEKIVVDGLLKENIWQRPGFSNLLQQDPDQGVKPSQPSEVWIAYDDEAIYFAARFYDSSPDSIMARLVRRDFIWGDPSDGCVLYLDSYRDKRSGYFFYVSAAGTLADGLIENDVKQPNDLSWDAVWEGVPNIDDKGWSVEMKIPFSQLRFNKGDSQIWGINVERFISRRVETDMIVYTPRNESGFTSRFPDLVGIEGFTPPSDLELLPYVTGKAEYISSDPNDPFYSGGNYIPGLGLDLRTGLGNSLTLNGTVNPDFGQVEVDPAIVNLTDVEYTFQEKRPFFTEGASIYRFGRGGTNNNMSLNWTNPSIFYSRRIGRNPQGGLPAYDYADVPNGTHILGAGKISGQIMNDWKVGTISAITQKEFAEIDVDGNRSAVEVEPLTYYGVFRAQKDFNGGEQGIGLLSTFTHRFFDDPTLKYYLNTDALVTGADGWTLLDNDRTYVLTGWTAFSYVNGAENRMISLQRSSQHYFQRPDASHINVDSSATSLTGYAGRLMLNKNRGQFTFNTAVGFMSPKFEVNDLGYGAYSDIINAHVATFYRWNNPTEIYQNAGIYAATFANLDFGGNNTDQGYTLGGYMTLHNLYGGEIYFSYQPETYNARRTRGGPLMLNLVSKAVDFNLNTDMREWWVVNISGNFEFGEDINYQSISTNLELKATTTLTLSVGPEISQNSTQAQWIVTITDPIAKETYGKRYVFAQLEQTTFAADIRADWIISPTLSLQAYIQPLVASGKYTDFKALARPKSFDFLKYGEGASTINETIAQDGSTIKYSLDVDGEGPSEAVTIGNPDFNYISLRGNAVLRWEYMPGSTIFFVWTQSREDVQSDGNFYFRKSMNNLLNVQPDNIFMLKITYRL